MFEQLPGDRRHPAGHVDLLALDDRERLERIPFVHEHQAMPPRDRTHQHRRTRGDVEQRDHHEQHLGGRLGRHLAAAQEAARAVIGRGHDVGQQVAMRAQRTLGVAGGAAGVEDRSVVIGGQIGLGQLAIGQVGIAGGQADDRFERRAIGGCGLAAAHDNLFECGERGTVRGDSRQPFVIADQHLGARIGDPIGQFGPGPPRVERHADRPNRGRRKERHRPFGQVAHRQRNAIALGHAAAAQMLRQRRNRTMPGIITDPLVLVDKESAVAIRAPLRSARPVRGSRFSRCGSPARGSSRSPLRTAHQGRTAAPRLRPSSSRAMRRRSDLDSVLSLCSRVGLSRAPSVLRAR